MKQRKWEKRSNELMSFSEFIKEWKDWGFKIACSNWLIVFTKWFIKAKRIKIIYN